MKVVSNLFWNKNKNPFNYFNLNYFSNLLQNLQQFKRNEYDTKWCSIRRVTKLVAVAKVSYPSRIPANIAPRGFEK